jgi:hypothetical protein
MGHNYGESRKESGNISGRLEQLEGGERGRGREGGERGRREGERGRGEREEGGEEGRGS